MAAGALRTGEAMSFSGNPLESQELSKSDFQASELLPSHPEVAYQRSERWRLPVPTDVALIDDRYEVVGRPYLGGMGVVYPCFDKKEQRAVALKTFRPEFLSNRDARERFLEEGRAPSLSACATSGANRLSR